MSSYVMLCTAQCLAVFSLAFLGASVILNSVFPILQLRRKASWDTSPSTLFFIAVAPFIFAAAIALGLALPAFLVFEPRATHEAPEVYLILLAGLSLSILCLAIVRAWKTATVTSLLVRYCSRGARKLFSAGKVPVYELDHLPDLLAVTGIMKPKVFIGREVLASLSKDELSSALAHEFAHITSRDNLKRLLLHMTRFPLRFCALGTIEKDWAQAAECTADDEALLQPGSAVDLTAAIVKLVRLQGPDNSVLLPAEIACHLVTSRNGVELRLKRLRDVLSGAEPTPEHKRGSVSALLGFLLLCYLFSLPAMLPFTHRCMEWLVR